MSDGKLLGAVVTAYWYNMDTDTVVLRLRLMTGEIIDAVHLRVPATPNG
jgi:hypothetical protein